MSGFGAALDAYDWLVDAVRGLFGLRPLPQEILKLSADELTVRRPANVEIETRRARMAFLRARQDNGVLFEGPAPRDGKVTILPLTLNPVEFQVIVEPRHPANSVLRFESVLEPAPNGPPIERFDAPATVILGDDIACGWSALRSERVRIAAICDGKVADYIGPPVGELAVPTTRPGRVLLRLIAEASWGQSTLTRVVMVQAPKLKLMLLRPALQVGCPGDIVRFEWRTVSAEHVWLIGPPPAPPQRIPDRNGGYLDITLGLRPVEYQIVAQGYGGAERSAVLRGVPKPFAALEE